MSEAERYLDDESERQESVFDSRERRRKRCPAQVHHAANQEGGVHHGVLEAVVARESHVEWLEWKIGTSEICCRDADGEG